MALYQRQDYEGNYNAVLDDDFDPGALEDGNDIHVEREKDYESLFKAAGRMIKSKKKFLNERDVDQFFDEYGDIAGKHSPRVTGSLLHLLVEIVTHTDEIEPEHVKLLVERLVKRHPELLKYPNKDGHNPILMAIRATTPQHRLVDYMVSACVACKEEAIYGDCLNSALMMKAQQGKTCLHFALREKFDPDTIRLLVENASDKALAVQDELGKTPMHYAVSFQKCTDLRTKLIALFIERDLNAIQSRPPPPTTFLDLVDESGTSVYQEHQRTRASVTKAYNDYVAKQRRAAESTKRVANDASRLPDRTAVREPRSQTSARDPRHMATAKSTAERDAEKAGRDGDSSDLLDEREKLRQKKKAEEAARVAARQEASEEPMRNDRSKDYESAGPDASRNRSAMSNEPGQNASPLGIETSNMARPLDPTPNTPIKRSNTARIDGKPEYGKDYASARPTLATRPSTNSDKPMDIYTRNSDSILLDLKLHYMRTRNAEMAIFFLYGTNMDDVQISFDFDRLPRKMVWNEFIKRFGPDGKSGLKFDRVLQYVAFPQVEVQRKGRLADLERDAELHSGVRQLGGLGRKDMKYFLEWLYKKGVRHIIRLSIEDSGDSDQKVHSDQAIQESLERFIVEHLDWQKTDLDPETILHVSSKAIEKEAPTGEDPQRTELLPARQLKHLYLRWSGSNAVLRAWSEAEGLPLLPFLRRIYLFVPPVAKTYDNPQWIRQKVQAFQTRLNANRKAARAQAISAPDCQDEPDSGEAFNNVEVILTDSGTDEEHNANSGDTPHFTNSSPVTGVNSHRWLDSASRFAAEMIPFWQTTVKNFLESRQNRGTPERTEDDVVLALIDDGVDMFDTVFSNQVLEGKSFDFHDGKVRPPFSSAKGHGTVMASMILRICPMAKVYPIRLKTYNNANGKNNIDPGYAAQAVQAALDKKATIISMSWTLPITKGTSDSKSRLHAVLQKAVDSKVLMFCSAPDEGKFTELDYPSGPWRDHFFRIGAARADGTVFRWTPDDGITYVLPGVDVIKDVVGNSSFETSSTGGVTKRVVDFKYETGSSVATALAAGLAAMIIYCVKASILAVKTANQSMGPIVGIAIPDNGATLIADPNAMKRAFAKLGKVTPNNFIQVWEELDKVSEMLETSRAQNATPEAKLKCIERFVAFGLMLSSSIKQ